MVSNVLVLLDILVPNVKQTGMNAPLVHVGMQFTAM